MVIENFTDTVFVFSEIEDVFFRKQKKLWKKVCKVYVVGCENE
jgi:hypothetical protein